MTGLSFTEKWKMKKHSPTLFSWTYRVTCAERKLLRNEFEMCAGIAVHIIELHYGLKAFNKLLNHYFNPDCFLFIQNTLSEIFVFCLGFFRTYFFMLLGQLLQYYSDEIL